MHVCWHVWLFATLRTVACQAPLSLRIFRQEYWSGLLFPHSGNFPNPGIVPHLLCLLNFQLYCFLLSHLESPIYANKMGEKQNKTKQTKKKKQTKWTNSLKGTTFKTQLWRNRKYEEFVYKYWNWKWLKNLQQTKVQNQMTSHANSIKHLENN